MQSAVLEKTPTADYVANGKRNGTDNGVKRYKWTKNEYYRMAELGFFQNKRVELIEGEIIEMSPMKSAHATALVLVSEVLRKVFSSDHVIRTQMPMNFSVANQPEPDAAVIKGDIRDFAASHPKTAVLIIEVSDSTLRYDQVVKTELYARNKIQEYWIVNLKNRCLEVYRQPKKDKKLGFLYGEIQIIGETESIAPLTAPKAKIKIADLLP